MSAISELVKGELMGASSLSSLMYITATVYLSLGFVFAQNQDPKEFRSYYGKTFNSMISAQVRFQKNTPNARFIPTIDPEVLRDEMFRVLSLNHIEKADQ